MSGEQLTAKELNKTLKSDSSASRGISKVNINDLLHKVRTEKNKEKKENFMFVGLVIGVLAVTGFIASL